MIFAIIPIIDREKKEDICVNLKLLKDSKTKI